MSTLEKPKYFKDHTDLCHDFALDPFFQGERMTYMVRLMWGGKGRRMSTDKEFVYSYNTRVACATKTLDDKTAILITDGHHSKHTQKQLWALRHATSHFVHITVPSTLLDYREPLLRRKAFDSYVNTMTLLIKENSIRLKASREEFCSLYERMEAYAKHIDPEVAELLPPFKETYDNLKEGNLKAIRERANKELQEARRIVAELIKGKSISELGELAWTRDGYYPHIRDELQSLRKSLTNNGKNSFVWFDYDAQLMRSSQRSSIPLDTAVITMKRYLSGKLKLGDTVENYRVIKINPDSLRVNCHDVTRKNIEDCIAEYEARKKAGD